MVARVNFGRLEIANTSLKGVAARGCISRLFKSQTLLDRRGGVASKSLGLELQILPQGKMVDQGRVRWARDRKHFSWNDMLARVSISGHEIGNVSQSMAWLRE